MSVESNGLLTEDRGNPKIPRHAMVSSTDDEFETPPKLFRDLCEKYILLPVLDVAATSKNKKCISYFTKSQNSLEHEWRGTVWCNHPHTLHEQFVEKCHQQWSKNNIDIIMIIPANCCRTTYWHKWIEGIAEYHAIKGSIRFLQNGKLSKDSSRNAYLCVIWRKKK